MPPAPDPGSSVRTDDGVRLACAAVGDGTPVLFVHEFAGDQRSWSAQVSHFSPRYRCLTYCARGYPPSDVPKNPASYTQERAVADAVAVLDGLGVERAHGHAVNIEEPAQFNRLVGHFLAAVEAGRWGPRDPGSPSPDRVGGGGAAASR